MRKLSEYENEEAIDLLADLLDPVSAILADKKIPQAINQKKGKMKAIQIALKEHKSEVIEILAILEGVPVEEYHANLPKMTMNLLELLNDKEMTDFFTSQAQTEEEKSSSFAMVNTEEKEQ